MGKPAVAPGAGLAGAATGETTPGRKTAPGANAAGSASNGLPGANKPWVSLNPLGAVGE